MSEKLEIQLIEAGGGGPGPAPSGGPGPAPKGGPSGVGPSGGGGGSGDPSFDILRNIENHLALQETRRANEPVTGKTGGEKEKATGGMGRQALQVAEQQLGGIAELNIGAVAEGVASLSASIPGYGIVVAETIRATQRFMAAIDNTAARLSQFNGQLAAEAAMANVRQITGDIRRAELLSPELSSYTRARSRLSETGQDAMAELLKPLIPQVTEMVNGLAEVISYAKDMKGTAVATQVVFETLATTMTFGFSNVLKQLYKLVGNSEKDEQDNPIRDALLELFKGGGFAGGRGPGVNDPGRGGAPRADFGPFQP